MEDWGEEMSGREVKYTVQAFQSEKAYCAAFCASPAELPYLRVQVIMQAVMVCNAWKTAVDCNKVSEDVNRLIQLFILGQT